MLSKALHIAKYAAAGLALAALVLFLLGFVVAWLWNWLMPEIFGLPTITYWQAWGLLVLAHLLIGAGRTVHED